LAFSGIKPIVGRGKPRPPFARPELAEGLCYFLLGEQKKVKKENPGYYGYTWISSTFVANHRWNNGIKQAFNFA